ncbi:REP-associated tyrosine transposase [Methylomonas rivi]|uniref:Transposase n=1 Tax=Methylomonas rivi TaxID=2952226 RepID=A0ABT1U991_9GAMM|nr:transposase [Methylomonas sp. WSC-6]MCQ8130423.1 transposase [Methylomonas sp. WSC-6]
MTDIRRYSADNRPVFITAVCYQRKPVLANASEKELLLTVMREVKAEMPFRLLAYVILDDHFHWLIKPEPDVAFSSIVQSVKLRFTHRYKRAQNLIQPVTLWQKRFWDHLIRDQDDLHQHLDYIHYNPVKHGRVSDPADYPWSSFLAHQANGSYPNGWGTTQPPASIGTLNFE